MISLILFLSLISLVLSSAQTIDQQLDDFKNNSGIKGIQLQITKGKDIIYHYNNGQKNNKDEVIDNNTVVRIASLSKSFASVAFMQLVQQNKIALNTSISQALGFEVVNPYYPHIPITLEMIMSHQSSIVDCDPTYINFLYLTRLAKTAQQIPSLKELIHKNGQYYDKCLFNNQQPGSHFEYSNFNYGIIGSVIQRITGIRFDIYQRENILKYLSTNQTQIPTFSPWKLLNHNNLAALYRGFNNLWVVQADYYPSGVIQQPNLTNYKIGSNGIVFSPQAGLRASVTHLNNYMYMLSNKGITKQNIRILKQSSVLELIKPRYQFHGVIGGDRIYYQNYGFGIAKTSYLPVDRVIDHEAIYGHTGQDCGLLSGYYFWKDFAFSYYFTGSTNGYTVEDNSFYEKERKSVYQIVNRYLSTLTDQF